MKQTQQSLIITWVLSIGLGLVWAGEPNWPAMPYTPHWEFQAVDVSGFGTFPVTDPVKMRGVILNEPEEMLDPTPGAPNFLGGLWQIYVQTVDEDDFGGTACWMGQYIGKIVGNHPAGSYSDPEWLAELYRLEHDPDTGHEFQPGDLVEIRARAPGLHFRGKTNVNEQHSNVPEADFDICLLEADYGLPMPTLFTLSDVKDQYDEFIFDPQRLVGVEHYQAMFVRVNDVEFVSTQGWGPDAELTIQDGTGRTFPVKLGIGDGFSIHDPPTGPVDIIAIFDQEDYDPENGLMDGYRLWVMNYDGNGFILPGVYIVPGDTNCDGAVDSFDIDPFVLALTDVQAYAAQFPECDASSADVNGDGVINAFDIDPFVALLTG